MKYRKLDAAGDYTLGTGRDFWVDVPEAVAAAVQTRLGLWAGEWFLDAEAGTPWAADILGYSRRAYDAAVQARVLGTPGVQDIIAYSSQLADRRLTIRAKITTDYGQAAITGVYG
jgi:hypothetical protein